MWTALVVMKNIHFATPLGGLTMTEVEVGNTTFENITFAGNPAELPAMMEQGGAVPAGISAGGSPVANVSVLSWWTWAAQAGKPDGLKKCSAVTYAPWNEYGQAALEATAVLLMEPGKMYGMKRFVKI